MSIQIYLLWPYDPYVFYCVSVWASTYRKIPKSSPSMYLENCTQIESKTKQKREISLQL